MLTKRVWLLFDSRFYENKDKSIVYCSADSHREAIQEKVESFTDAVIVIYEKKGNQLINCSIDHEAMNEADRRINGKP